MTSGGHPGEEGFSVGVCAAGESENLGALIEVVLAEADEIDLPLRRVTVVASGCPAAETLLLEQMALSDARILPIVEGERHGKAEALNRVIESSLGRFLVLLNADAAPEKGAIVKLLSMINTDATAGVVSANPEPKSEGGLTSMLVDLMWAAHNECALTLNHMNISNQSCDELVVLRSEVVSRLPEGLVNDGAYLAAMARRRGYTVKFCPPARVRVSAPALVSSVIGQRRRILFGHVQVWRRTGGLPRTVESMIMLRPALGLKLLVRTVARRPAFLLTLPVAAVTELSAALLSIWDGLRSTKRHAIWRRYS